MRPRRKMTPRSYSLRILMPLTIKMTTMMMNVPAGPTKSHIIASTDRSSDIRTLTHITIPV